MGLTRRIEFDTLLTSALKQSRNSNKVAATPNQKCGKDKMTDYTSTLLPVRFTPESLTRLEQTVNEKANFTFDASYNWFDQINYFQPDGSAHIELGRSDTKSGNPFVIDFDADDFEYAE